MRAARPGRTGYVRGSTRSAGPRIADPFQVLDSLTVVGWLQFDADTATAVDDGPVDLGAHAHERGENRLIRVRPEHDRPLDHVELERVDVPLVLGIAGILEGRTRSSRTSSQNAEAYCLQIQWL